MKLVVFLVVFLAFADAKLSFGNLFGKRLDLRSTAQKIARKLSYKSPYFPLFKRIIKAKIVKPSTGPFTKPLATKTFTKPTPEFCGTSDCPFFYEKKLNISDRNVANYTLRCYPNPYRWVSTTVQGMESREAGRKAFWRLFKYIQGANEKNEKIKMTVPVTMQMQPDETSSSFCKNNYTMSFFIPFKHQKDAPAPSADDVYLTDTKPFCAYVKVYDSYSNEEKVKQNYKDLVEALKRDGFDDDFQTDVIYSAGYDGPRKFWNRHNEIWLISKKHSPVSSLVESRILIQ